VQDVFEGGKIMDNKSKCCGARVEKAFVRDGTDAFEWQCCACGQPCVEPEPQKVRCPDRITCKYGGCEQHGDEHLPNNDCGTFALDCPTCVPVKPEPVELSKVEKEIINTNPDLLGKPEPQKKTGLKYNCLNCSAVCVKKDKNINHACCYYQPNPEPPEPQGRIRFYIQPLTPVEKRIQDICLDQANRQLQSLLAQQAREILHDFNCVFNPRNIQTQQLRTWEQKFEALKSKYIPEEAK
jgi:hypothetical protein